MVILSLQHVVVKSWMIVLDYDYRLFHWGEDHNNRLANAKESVRERRNHSIVYAQPQHDETELALIVVKCS